jgi:hypothetical protein
MSHSLRGTGTLTSHPSPHPAWLQEKIDRSLNIKGEITFLYITNWSRLIPLVRSSEPSVSHDLGIVGIGVTGRFPVKRHVRVAEVVGCATVVTVRVTGKDK